MYHCKLGYISNSITRWQRGILFHNPTNVSFTNSAVTWSYSKYVNCVLVVKYLLCLETFLKVILREIFQYCNCIVLKVFKGFKIRQFQGIFGFGSMEK